MLCDDYLEPDEVAGAIAAARGAERLLLAEVGRDQVACLRPASDRRICSGQSRAG